MGSSVAAKANHYEVLGLTPSANESQIARAFADAMSMFRVRPVAALAEISAAYETLRNPAKRREYDRSIGIGPPPAAPRQWAIAAPAVRWAPLPGSAAFTAPSAPEQPAGLAKRDVEVSDADPASAIGASLREIARPGSFGAPVDRKEPGPQSSPSETAIPNFLAEPRLDADEDLQERAFNWTKPAFAVGGFVIAAGLIGTLAGLSVKDNAQSIGGEREITAALPAAKARTKPETDSAAIAAPSDEGAPVVEASPAPDRRSTSHHQPSSWVEHSVREAQAVESAPTAVPAEQEATDPLAPDSTETAAQPVAASLPLPSGVVARTIERIGYSCGKVASSAAVDGSPGVFTITCTSGQRYQASPVHGRYRFRRLGGQ